MTVEAAPGPDQRQSVKIQLIGGPTVLIEIGGLRLLTDPTFDPPGDHPVGARVLVKTSGPAISQADVGTIHAVLLSHDQHPDNLDDAGREFLRAVPLVLTTAAAAERLESVAAVPVRPWRSTHLNRPAGGEVKVTAVPAQHGPDGTEDIVGSVLGFILSGDSLPTVYVSGDNASLHVVDQVRQHAGPIDIAILFLGAARTPLLDAYLTLGSADAPQAAAILQARVVIPVHNEGWAHFTNTPQSVVDAFRAAGRSDQLVLLQLGQGVSLWPGGTLLRTRSIDG
jgi:L-ascorbate metabolism protein UlaG (beta-lactamase superfamily)